MFVGSSPLARSAPLSAALGLALLVTTPALAQNPIPRIPTDRNGRQDPRPLQPRCWERGPALGPDWLAELDSEYRRRTLTRYALEPISDGWRWYPRRLVEARNLRPSREVKGLAESELTVRIGDHGGRARYRIDGGLHSGEVALEWARPPSKLCANELLDLYVGARVIEGDPGHGRIGVILPLSEEQRAADGTDVRACSPGAVVAVDSVEGIRKDEGRCRRLLDHIPPGSAWSILVVLPESFYIVYRYEPVPER